MPQCPLWWLNLPGLTTVEAGAVISAVLASAAVGTGITTSPLRVAVGGTISGTPAGAGITTGVGGSPGRHRELGRVMLMSANLRRPGLKYDKAGEIGG